MIGDPRGGAFVSTDIAAILERVAERNTEIETILGEITDYATNTGTITATDRDYLLGRAGEGQGKVDEIRGELD